MPNKKGSPDLSEPLMPADEKPPMNRRKSTATRVQEAIASVAEKSPNENIKGCLAATAPLVAMVVRLLLTIAPYFLWFYGKCYELYVAAPKNLLTMGFGLALCFYGGTFVASIAAIEAFRQLGWKETYAELKIVWAEVKSIYAASLEDDKLDDDGDGVADVEQIPPHVLAQRKFVLAMRTVSEPKRLQAAFGHLWAAYLAVLATLRLQFAQTAAIALGIAETILPRVKRVALAPMEHVLAPLECDHWAETLLDSGIKLISVIIAWWFQMIVSAFYSAMRGGKLFAQGLCALIVEKGWTEHVEALPGVPKPFDPETTYIDEIVGYLVAAVGFGTQLCFAFSIGFPINVLLLPLEIIEWFLRWQITFTSGTANGALPASG